MISLSDDDAGRRHVTDRPAMEGKKIARYAAICQYATSLLYAAVTRELAAISRVEARRQIADFAITYREARLYYDIGDIIAEIFTERRARRRYEPYSRAAHFIRCKYCSSLFLQACTGDAYLAGTISLDICHFNVIYSTQYLVHHRTHASTTTH